MRGDFLGPPHGTTPAAVITNKNKKVKIAKKTFIRKKDVCQMENMADLSLLGANSTLGLFCHEDTQIIMKIYSGMYLILGNEKYTAVDIYYVFACLGKSQMYVVIII